jgi:uncharacterized membrane protein YgcG
MTFCSNREIAVYFACILVTFLLFDWLHTASKDDIYYAPLLVSVGIFIGAIILDYYRKPPGERQILHERLAEVRNFFFQLSLTSCCGGGSSGGGGGGGGSSGGKIPDIGINVAELDADSWPGYSEAA